MIEEKHKIKTNLVKLSHSLLISGLSSIYLYSSSKTIQNLIFFISGSYFTVDTKLILNRENIDYPILYHHISALFLLFAFYLDYYSDILIYIYTLAEISNIPMYITYHLIKTKSDNTNLILCSNIIQTLLYGYLRVYCFTYSLIKNTHLIYTPLVPLLGVYMIGLFWFCTLCKQIYNERLTIQYLIHDRFLRNV